MDRNGEQRWTSSVYEFPEADHSQNLPAVIGVPRPSVDDTIREYCGMEISR
jgi:hypothetical protein